MLKFLIYLFKKKFLLLVPRTKIISQNHGLLLSKYYIILYMQCIIFKKELRLSCIGVEKLSSMFKLITLDMNMYKLCLLKYELI